MALEVDTVSQRPFMAAGSGSGGGGDRELFAAGNTTVPVLLAKEKQGWPVDEVIWGDEKRMKRELVVWAKAVASMAASSSGKNTTSSPSSSPWPPMRRRG